METNACKIMRVLKRLKTGVGYHELGMPAHALRCLDSLTQLGKIGPFGLVVELLRDEFSINRETPIAETMETLARMLPTPAKHAIELTLAACYGQGHDAARTANNKACGRGVQPGIEPKTAT